MVVTDDSLPVVHSLLLNLAAQASSVLVNGPLLAKSSKRVMRTYVAIELLKTSFYNNFHVTTTLPPSITYQHLQMWPANESASNNNLQSEHKHKMRPLCAVFFALVCVIKFLAKHRKITLANIS